WLKIAITTGAVLFALAAGGVWWDSKDYPIPDWCKFYEVEDSLWQDTGAKWITKLSAKLRFERRIRRALARIKSLKVEEEQWRYFYFRETKPSAVTEGEARFPDRHSVEFDPPILALNGDTISRADCYWEYPNEVLFDSGKLKFRGWLNVDPDTKEDYIHVENGTFHLGLSRMMREEEN
ncbi:MAG: hypothetical protein HKN23_05090, partial [Verrucomicrobiales bacterium]|nr:hypothetical protein [Verrucomicrobiales bacterium]